MCSNYIKNCVGSDSTSSITSGILYLQDIHERDQNYGRNTNRVNHPSSRTITTHGSGGENFDGTRRITHTSYGSQSSGSSNSGSRISTGGSGGGGAESSGSRSDGRTIYSYGGEYEGNSHTDDRRNIERTSNNNFDSSRNYWNREENNLDGSQQNSFGIRNEGRSTSSSSNLKGQAGESSNAFNLGSSGFISGSTYSGLSGSSQAHGGANLDINRNLDDNFDKVLENTEEEYYDIYTDTDDYITGSLGISRKNKTKLSNGTGISLQ